MRKKQIIGVKRMVGVFFVNVDQYVVIIDNDKDRYINKQQKMLWMNGIFDVGDVICKVGCEGVGDR